MITKRGKVYYTDFDVNDRRVRLSLKTGNEVEAMKLAVAKYEEMTAGPKQVTQTANGPDMLMVDAIDRVYKEVWASGRDTHKECLCMLAKSTIKDGLTLRTITRDDLKDIVKVLQAEKLKDSTINRRIRVITAAHNYARAEWAGYENLPPLKYKALKEPQTRLRYLSDDEIAQLLEAEDDRRWRIFWMAQLEIGQRMSDGLSIEWRYFDWKLGTYFNPNSKTNNPQALPLSQKLMDEFQWLKEQGYKRPFDYPRFTVRTRFMRLKKRAKLDDPSVTVHTLRHTCATRLLANGADIREVQIWLGHSTIKTTERYAKVVPTRLMALRDRIHGSGQVSEV